MASISCKRSGSSTPPSPPVENLPQFVDPISVCTCSANILIACPYHMMKPSLTDQDPQGAVKQEPFTGNSSICTNDFLGVSFSPSTPEQAEKTSDGSYAPDQVMKLFGVWVTVPGRGSFDSSPSSVSSQTSKRKRQEKETKTIGKDQAEKTSDGSSAPVQYITRLFFGGSNTVLGRGFSDFFPSASSQTNKRKKKEKKSTTMESEGASSNGGLNHHHHPLQSDIEKEAERLEITLELTLSSEFQKSNIESRSSITSSVPKESVVCNSTEDTNQVKKSTIASGVVEDSWVFHKKLTLSDIADRQSRLLLTKRSVEDHLLPKLGFSITKNGTKIVVRDLDKKSDHQMTLALWSDGKSYVLIKNWRKDFVERRGLKDGDEIELCWKAAEAAFTFRLLRKRIRRPEEEGPS